MKAFRPTIPPATQPPTSRPQPGIQPGTAAGPVLAACCRWDASDIILTVKVHPRGKKFELGRVVGGALRVKVAAPPEHGRATDELLAELAEAFGVRPGSITLIRGALTPQKVIRITNPQIVPPEIIA